MHSRVGDLSFDVLEFLLELGQRCLHAVIVELVLVVVAKPIR